MKQENRAHSLHHERTDIAELQALCDGVRALQRPVQHLSVSGAKRRGNCGFIEFVCYALETSLPSPVEPGKLVCIAHRGGPASGHCCGKSFGCFYVIPG